MRERARIKPLKAGPAVLLTLVAVTAAQGQALAPERVAGLRGAPQARLDSLHAAGRFPGATLGVTLPDDQSMGLAAIVAAALQP